MVKNDQSSNENYQTPPLAYQIFLYFTFAGLMVGLNILIQNFHLSIVYPWLKSEFGSISFLQSIYFSTTPYNMPEIIGSAVAVVITYIVKFLLDKYLVFRKRSGQLKEIGTQFGLYFLFALITTGENLLIQFLLGIWTDIGLNNRIIIALTCGYITKFLLDRRYSFKVSGNKK